MRITTWNVNGLRAAIRKGFEEHISRVNPDVLMLQEVRALPEQLPKQWRNPEGWHVTWHPAEKKGYSGTAIWTRDPHTIIARGINEDGSDPEGRVLHAKVKGTEVVCVYLPSGSSGDHRQAEKEKWMDVFMPWARKLKSKRTPVLLGGDFNIAHTPRDIFYAKSNEKSSGFLPHERAWMGDFIQMGYADYVREQAGDIDGPYSWWSNRGKARELDRGWRIDYLLGNKAASRIAGNITIDREAGLACSDHAPVTIELDI
ncbi:Exodeoxyribonuclease [Poriferisphaera corsica]|uniref:Exodeoxyribonuclease n=1 Tax=Poriferisphaera corsica TaxID=2528020 RepID=A0A517YUC8_9BACT|nr:exodeoxyribonuclease III [Poriferisphaera corsica]QDU33845.1 Exodeoxyribonuclease [Poriferisphaera corsica]